MRSAAFTVVIACAGIALPACAQSSFEGAGANTEVACDGGTASIIGAGNTVTVTGRCSQLVIEGAGNRVRVDLASKGMIRVKGASNTVIWTMPDQSKPQVRVSGAGNRITRER